MKTELASHLSQAPPGFERAVVTEYLQARVLQAIGLSGQMTSVAFMGGTALRFLYAIPRYSEDLDFALEGDSDRYDFAGLTTGIVRTFEREGYVAEIAKQRDRTAVQKAFVKFPGLLHELGLSPHASEVVSVKIEVDTNPPAGAVCEVGTVRRFVVARILHHDKASLLAGKLAAVLMRQYTKGRDLYDLLWYLADPGWPQPNLELLRNAVAQGGWDGPALDEDAWREVVLDRLKPTDWEKGRREVVQFLERPAEAAMLEYETFEKLLSAR